MSVSNYDIIKNIKSQYTRTITSLFHMRYPNKFDSFYIYDAYERTVDRLNYNNFNDLYNPTTAEICEYLNYCQNVLDDLFLEMNPNKFI